MTGRKITRTTKILCRIAVFTAFCGASINAQALGGSGSSARRSSSALTAAQKKMLLDSDGDGLPNVVERQLGLKTHSRDSNSDGTPDGAGDANSNGMTDALEFNEGRFDTDGDGIADADERSLKSDPYNADSNGDGISDGEELGTTHTRSGSFEGDDGNDGEDDSDQDDGTTPVRPRPTVNSRPPKTGQPPKKNPIRPCRSPRQRNCYRRPSKPGNNPSTPPGASTPSASPTARPPTVPPVVPPTGNFDSSGNTTKFGIPSGMTGNVGRGAPIWSSTCSGCHGSEKSNRSFAQIKGSLSIPAMSGIRLGDSSLADLVSHTLTARKSRRHR